MEDNKNKIKGFTLLELLIAVAIFTTMVVLVVGSFGFSAKYQRQVRSNRDISQGVRFAVTEISNQVNISYNGPVVNAQGSNIIFGGENVYNFAILNGPNSRRTVRNGTMGNVLMIRGGDDYCRYFRRLKDGDIYRVAMWINTEKGCLGQWQGPNYLTGGELNVLELKFSGITNIRSANRFPYVEIWIKAENKDKDEFYIPMESRTTATIRNYGREV